MKIFLQREIREAYAHAAAGGQALHVCNSVGLVTTAAPAVFRRSSRFAHLFDQDYERLMATAKLLGVRVILPQDCGTHRQHVDLCGKPLLRAIDLAEEIQLQEKQALMPLDLGEGL